MTVMRDKVYLACEGEIREGSLPGSRYRILQSGVLQGHSSLFQEAAFGGDKVVYAHNDGAVEVYSTTTWQLLSSHQLPEMTFAPTVAVSEDGAVFAISDGDTDRVELFDASGHRPFAGLEEVLTFNPTTTRVFGSPGSFRSAEADLVEGQVREIAKAGSWLTAGIYYGDHEFAIAGSSGVMVRDLAGNSGQGLSEMTAETLAVSPDGNLLCAADRGDEIACYGRGSIEGSTYAADRLRDAKQ